MGVKKIGAAKLLRKWIDFGIDYRIEHNPAFAERFFANEDAYMDRLDMETGVIESKDFCDYFLVTSDIVRWAKDVDRQMVGPGRGSAVGSLLCYTTRITEMDPMQYPMMMFERFIDPGRPDMPDIDLDFANPSRVFEYGAEKYGADRVSHIGNFQRYRGKSAVKALARVYQIPEFEIKPLTKLIVDRPDGDPRENDSVEDTIAAFAEAQEIIEQHPELRWATRLEGDYQTLSVHAAGMVISNEPIEETCALYTRESKDGDATAVIPFDKRDAEYLGMLKLDILGLSTMAMVGDVIEMVPDLTIEKVYALEPDDPKVLAGFAEADLTGVFQFDGRTTRSITEQLFEGRDGDAVKFLTLADINALSRPGALISGMTSDYVKIEQGSKKPSRRHAAIDAILGPTNGCLVYQEQVMKLGAEVGGFPGDKVGALRKIIGKKKAGGAFEEFYQEFRDGAKRLHDIDEGLARELWDFMAASSSYLFNIAHAAAYSLIAYWTMYLKVYYPAEFYAASLRYTKKTKDKDPGLALMQDAVRHGIGVHPPHVILSKGNWTPAEFGSSIQAGFAQIPGVGPTMVPLILAFREGWRPATTDSVLTWADLRRKTYRKQVKEPCEPYEVEVTRQRTRTLPDGTKERYKIKETVTRDWKSVSREVAPPTGVEGFGPTTIRKVEEWLAQEDPFEIHAAEKACDLVYAAISAGALPLLAPDCDARSLTKAFDQQVTFIGLVKEVRIIDVIEAERKRTNHSAEQVRADLKDPHLATKAKIVCTDYTGAEVHVNVSRYRYPKMAEDLAEAIAKQDVVHVQGLSRESFGPTIQADAVFVIDLSEEDA